MKRDEFRKAIDRHLERALEKWPSDFEGHGNGLLGTIPIVETYFALKSYFIHRCLEEWGGFPFNPSFPTAAWKDWLVNDRPH